MSSYQKLLLYVKLKSRYPTIILWDLRKSLLTQKKSGDLVLAWLCVWKGGDYDGVLSQSMQVEQRQFCKTRLFSKIWKSLLQWLEMYKIEKM